MSQYGPLAFARLQWQPTLYSHGESTILTLEDLTFAPKREVSNAFRAMMEAQASGEVILVFADIEHDDLDETVRVVSEDQGGVSYLNGQIVNYKYGGNLYQGCPFLTQLISDDDRAPRGLITVPDVDRAIGRRVLALGSSPEITLRLMKLSDFSDGVDGDNARTPTGTPDVEYEAAGFLLRNVAGDAIAVQGELQGTGIRGEPWPKTRATPDVCPGLYKP